MKAVVLIVALMMAVSGCVSGYTFTRDPVWLQSRGQIPTASFEQDRTACGGSPETEIYVAPLIMLPLMFTGILIHREAIRRCLEAQGWRVIEISGPNGTVKPDQD